MTDEKEQKVQRSDVGASIEATIKRGTGTRDEDKFRIKGKGEDAEEALRNFETQLEAVENEFAERVRALQPENVEEDDEWNVNEDDE